MSQSSHSLIPPPPLPTMIFAPSKATTRPVISSACSIDVPFCRPLCEHQTLTTPLCEPVTSRPSGRYTISEMCSSLSPDITSWGQGVPLLDRSGMMLMFAMKATVWPRAKFRAMVRVRKIVRENRWHTVNQYHSFDIGEAVSF